MEKVRIQDDLYNFVNGEWLENAVIPDDKPTTGGFADLNKGVEELLMGEFAEMSAKGQYPDKYLENAVAIYNAAKDFKRRNHEGIRPALPTLNKIKKLKDISSFNRNLKDFICGGLPLPFHLAVEPDLKHTERHCVMISGPSTILPDTTYYKEGMEQQKAALLGVWSQMAKAVLVKTRLSEEEQNLYIEGTLKFDALIAAYVKSSEEWSEYVKVYNPTSTRTVSSLLKPIKFRKLLADLFGDVPEQVIVAEPRWLKGFKAIFNEETFESYKQWAYVKELLGSTNLLSQELRELGSIYSRTLTGVAAIPAQEKHAYQLASSVYSEPIGLYYGKKYFGEEAKKDVIDMVKDIIEQYKVRIKTNDVLSEPTKEKAILKLSKMGLHMGYPDKIEEIYDKFVFDKNDSIYNIMSQIGRIAKAEALSKLSKPVNRDEWAMPGHLVNACYNPYVNDITFPAAILQAPFYSIKQSRSQNLGGIGAVIGHEISHAFDNNGANCDENGNLNNWWTKEDHKAFDKKTKNMIKEFEGIKLPWGEVNASLIVSENIADNGGMAVTLDLMKKLKGASYEEYFVNWAKVWCMKGKPEYLALLLRVDVHAPTILRANMQPRNFPEWYETFGVTSKDKMYIAPSKRVVIW